MFVIKFVVDDCCTGAVERRTEYKGSTQ